MNRIVTSTALSLVLAASAYAAEHTGATEGAENQGQQQSETGIGIQDRSHPGAMSEQEGQGTEGMAAGQQEGQPSLAQQASQDRLMQMTADDLTDKHVITAEGEDIGEVEKVVVSKADNKAGVVVEVGGFLGIGEKSVAIPLDQLELSDDNLKMRQQVASDELTDRYAYQEDQYSTVEEQQTIASAVQGGGAAALASFEELDQNGDGVVEREDVEDNETISSNWDQIDQNQDDKIDRAEFSAFEAQWQQQQQPEQPQQQPGMDQESGQQEIPGQQPQPGEESPSGGMTQ